MADENMLRTLMKTDTGPGVDDVLQAFHLIDRRLAAAPAPDALRLLRQRLGGELIGDADRVAATLAPAFTLVTHAGGTVTTTDRAALVETVRRQGRSHGAVMTWIQLADLLVDRDAIAGHGVVRTLLAATMTGPGWPDLDPADRCLTTIPLAFFIRFAAGLMVSEEIYLDAGASERAVLRQGSGPDPLHCARLLDAMHAGLATGDGE
jgi:hypothetical protein